MLEKNQTITVLVCSTVFAIGIILLGIGFFKFTAVNPPVQYMWSLTLCKVTNQSKWIGMELAHNENCPKDLTVKDGTPQTFLIPQNILMRSVPYEPVIYVTDKVKGTITFSHSIKEKVIFDTSALLSGLEETRFAYCGGQELVVLRDGPLDYTDGEFLTTDCENYVTGCIYEPARSLNKYAFDAVTIQLQEVPQEGSLLIVDSIILDAQARSKVEFPDAFIYYQVGGRGDTQDVGLILLVIGGILADLMPATLFFLISKPRTPD